MLVDKRSKPWHKARNISETGRRESRILLLRHELHKDRTFALMDNLRGPVDEHLPDE